MPKVPLSTITSGYGTVDTLNANFDAIEAAFDNTLSRDGDTPNQMSANLDMNGFSILNQGNPVTVEGFNWEGQWLTATVYQVGDVVQQEGSAYICVVAHTSGVFATDLAASRWQLVAQANFPTQTGNSGKYLTTNGTSASWDDVRYTPLGTGAVQRTAASKLQEYVSVKDFGAVGNGVTNDYAAIQAAIDYVASVGGGKVLCSGLTYRSNSPIIIKDDVQVNLEGGKFLFVISGSNDYGIRLRNRAEVCNGEIEIQSSGSPGSQAGIHAPVVIGPFYGDGGTVASPSVDEGVTGWAARNLVLSTNRDGKVAIQVIGGANNGIIENIVVPNSSTMFGVVHLDWGFVGTVLSNDIVTSRNNFNAGTAYTTHPNNIIIRNIKAGALSRTKTGVDTGSHVIRLSGVYNVNVQNVTAVQCTYAAIRVTAGDVGFEFAPVSVKPLRMKGIVVENVAVQNTTDSWLVYADSYADNVAGTGGYTPLLDPLHETDLEMRHITGKGSGGASVTVGLYIIQLRGGKFTDIDASGYLHGCLVDELVYGTQIHGRFHSNRGHGVYIHHGIRKPEDVLILSGTHCYQNGQDAGFSNPSGITIDGSIRCRVEGALLGHRTTATETTQTRGLRIESTAAIDVEIENCHVFSVKTSGVAYSLLSTTDYGIVKLFRNNTVASAVTNKYGGLNIIAINRFLASDGSEISHFTAQRASLSGDITPTAGTWIIGDTIFYSNPTGANTGTRCTASGSPGTWGAF